MMTSCVEFKKVLDEADVVIFVAKYDTNELLYLNRLGRKLLHLEANCDLAGKTCHELLHGLAVPCSSCHKEALREDKYQEHDYYSTILHKQYRVAGKLIVWQGEKAQIEFLRDITEEVAKKKAEELKEKEAAAALSLAMQKALEANQAKTDFLSRVSHDMRTPLNGILGMTELLLDRIDNDLVKRDLNHIKNSGQYLLNMINDTLDINKIESGKFVLHPVTCQSKQILNSVLKLVEPNLQEKKIKLVLDIKPFPNNILFLDTGRFEQVLLNIFSNAIKFSQPGSTIEMQVENISFQDGVITDKFVIRDYGCGMSQAFLEHAFEPFQQDYSLLGYSSQGSGLGLYIVKKTVEMMGGTISLESKELCGTTVTLILPLQLASEEQIRHFNDSHLAKLQVASIEGKRILLCEDHPLNSEIVVRLLGKRGVLVDVACNGQEGLEKYLAKPSSYYDLILMDIRMPLMDGLEAARAIRSSGRADAELIPIVAMTANAFDIDIKESKAAGMNSHLSKPVVPKLMYETIADQIELYDQMRQVENFELSNKKNILLVDDIDVNLAVLQSELQDKYNLYTATNGAEALEVLAQHPEIEGMITDLQMPVMDGVELIRKLRSDDRYRHLGILANTQFGDPEQEEKLYLLGVDDFVYKPTSLIIVVSSLESVLRKHGR